MFSLIVAVMLPVLIIAMLLLAMPAQDYYRRSRFASQRGAFKLISGVEIPDEWGQYSTQMATDFEVIHRPIWDTQTYVDNTTVLLNFFAAGQANVGLGNEVFPLKNSYLVCAIGVFFKDNAKSNVVTADNAAFASAFNDHVLLTNTGVLNVTIGSKGYGQFPLWKLLPGAGVWGVMAAGGTPPGGTTPVATNYSQLGMPDPRCIYTLAVPLVIPMSSNVVTTMTWAAVVDTTGNSSICLLFDGKEARPLQ